MSRNIEAAVCCCFGSSQIVSSRINSGFVAATPSSSSSSSSSTRYCGSLRSTFPDQRVFHGINGVSSSPERARRRIIQAQTGVQDQTSAAKEDVVKWWERDLGASLMDVHSAEELSNVIASAEGKLVVVEYFATWCGSCRALYPKLCKLATEHQDIVFVKVNFDENKAFCRTQNVKVLPYFHFYRGTLEQLDSFSCSIVKLKKLKDALTRYNISGGYANGKDSLSTDEIQNGSALS